MPAGIRPSPTPSPSPKIEFDLSQSQVSLKSIDSLALQYIEAAQDKQVNAQKSILKQFKEHNYTRAEIRDALQEGINDKQILPDASEASKKKILDSFEPLYDTTHKLPAIGGPIEHFKRGEFKTWLKKAAKIYAVSFLYLSCAIGLAGVGVVFPPLLILSGIMAVAFVGEFATSYYNIHAPKNEKKEELHHQFEKNIQRLQEASKKAEAIKSKIQQLEQDDPDHPELQRFKDDLSKIEEDIAKWIDQNNLEKEQKANKEKRRILAKNREKLHSNIKGLPTRLDSLDAKINGVLSPKRSISVTEGSQSDRKDSADPQPIPLDLSGSSASSSSVRASVEDLEESEIESGLEDPTADELPSPAGSPQRENSFPVDDDEEDDFLPSDDTRTDSVIYNSQLSSSESDSEDLGLNALFGNDSDHSSPISPAGVNDGDLIPPMSIDDADENEIEIRLEDSTSDQSPSPVHSSRRNNSLPADDEDYSSEDNHIELSRAEHVESTIQTVGPLMAPVEISETTSLKTREPISPMHSVLEEPVQPAEDPEWLSDLERNELSTSGPDARSSSLLLEEKNAQIAAFKQLVARHTEEIKTTENAELLIRAGQSIFALEYEISRIAKEFSLNGKEVKQLKSIATEFTKRFNEKYNQNFRYGQIEETLNFFNTAEGRTIPHTLKNYVLKLSLEKWEKELSTLPIEIKAEKKLKGLIHIGKRLEIVSPKEYQTQIKALITLKAAEFNDAVRKHNSDIRSSKPSDLTSFDEIDNSISSVTDQSYKTLLQDMLGQLKNKPSGVETGNIRAEIVSRKARFEKRLSENLDPAGAQKELEDCDRILAILGSIQTIQDLNKPLEAPKKTRQTPDLEAFYEKRLKIIIDDFNDVKSDPASAEFQSRLVKFQLNKLKEEIQKVSADQEEFQAEEILRSIGEFESTLEGQ